MITPHNITNYHRTTAELEEFLLFCICVAGKKSHIQAKKLDQFLHRHEPFPFIRCLAFERKLRSRMESVKLGQYDRLVKCFTTLASSNINLKTVSVEELEKIPGIGPKTARFFIMHSRPNQRVATLDTHILKWLKSQGVKNVPKNTPSGERYAKLEKVFLAICDIYQVNPADLDLKIWSDSAKKVA